MSFNILMCAILCSAGVSRPYPPLKAVIRDRSTSLRSIPFRQVIHDRFSQPKSTSEFVSETRTPIPPHRYILTSAEIFGPLIQIERWLVGYPTFRSTPVHI
ncbi:hypothetical protein AVEN_13772-1 [Araneus ventricosus]|uniref:Secreted protein n=1 Tax=Araneus ventricosus TaxID=182803 RepID=A0A4Y2W1Z0_ARAVE|nr:hypothetical protein AVEN_13772-1 [Araneus ventricosus]